jgi:hypothetical protein
LCTEHQQGNFAALGLQLELKRTETTIAIATELATLLSIFIVRDRYRLVNHRTNTSELPKQQRKSSTANMPSFILKLISAALLLVSLTSAFIPVTNGPTLDAKQGKIAGIG